MALVSVTRGVALLRELAVLLEGLSARDLADHKEEVAALFADVEEEVEFWREALEPLSLEEGSMPAPIEDLEPAADDAAGIGSGDESPVLRRHHSQL